MHTVRSIQKSLDLIEERLAEPVSLPELAQVAAMSLRHYQRTFSALVGEPVGRYLRRRRIAAAAKRLFDHQGTLLDLALEFQFESHEAFTRAFKAELGVTPSDWREGRGSIRFPRTPEALSSESLHQRSTAMTYLPEIVPLPPRVFIGLQSRFIASGSDEGNPMQVIPQLWDDFAQRIGELPNAEAGANYGLGDVPEAHGLERTHPDELLYLAAARVDSDVEPPEGMTRWRSPGGSFAKFEHHGTSSTIGDTMAYIYGEWFPQSDYDGSEGPDFVRIDHRYDPTRVNCMMEIYVSLQKRPPERRLDS
ncbi:AraC family transcriptional regulator [Pelagicoccus sp. SDUM812003]|uniref:AraC family transcriptional regulator n=1 Tax=Pelagicoccus sp. SDUM812003 TaxID=3041267 RepID=UPI00280D1A73|nr:AraC family transcriptional regulator [Pelagicoccus sp. SDUM812003]MDQ8203056.1 AraC family transcriptional regulator [Pelagicoccus sp. SDUM812003]